MSADMEIEGEVALPKTIELYGLFGAFRIENSPYLIRYVSTFANPTRSDGHSEFVDELMPMRDRVKPGDLRDLRSLLQRDLNDRRVATELVPYLQGLTQSGIGFFPAILAVIVPKGYLLNKEPRPSYPKPSEPFSECVTTINYGGCWTVDRYKVKDKYLPLGRFKIVESKTDIIVLDGQHRASAFRYIAGNFKPEGSIYQTFYKKLPADPHIDADLPVTLIWFESDGAEEIDPMLISRKLFVDVNNSAKPVSLARTYLLDDRRVSCIGTQELYNFAADRGYKPDKFSLLHSAFDMDVDLAKRPGVPCFTLTTPEIIEGALQFAFLGSDISNTLGYWKVERLFHRQKSTTRFKTIWPRFKGLQVVGTEDEEDAFVGIADPAEAEVFRELMRTDYLPVLKACFDNLGLLEPHYTACKETATWAQKEANTTVLETWDKVFCGGEGLYWSLKDAADNERAKKYRDAIREVESKFRENRSAAFGNAEGVDQVYTSFASKAFQCGFLMAIDYLAYLGDGKRLTKFSPFIEKLGEFRNAHWAVLFNELWPQIRPGQSTDPKAWPTYRNLLLRMYDNGEQSLYSMENLSETPDWMVCDKLLVRAANAIYDADGTAPEAADRKKRAKAELTTAEDLLTRSGIIPIWTDKPQAVIKRADARLEELVNALLATD